MKDSGIVFSPYISAQTNGIIVPRKPSQCDSFRDYCRCLGEFMSYGSYKYNEMSANLTKKSPYYKLISVDLIGKHLNEK